MAQDTSAQSTTTAGARRRFHLSQRQIEELMAYLFISPWIIGFLIFTLGAMIFSLGLSFFRTDLLSTWIFVGPNNYIALAQDPLFLQSLKVTTIYTLATVPLSTIIALSISLMLNQGVVFQGGFRVIYYLPALVTGVAVTILWSWVLNPDTGLLNGLLRSLGVPRAALPRWFVSEQWALPSLILMSLWGAGANMLLYLAGLQGIPTHLYEAARIDGANPWQQFWNITLPMLSPTILLNMIMATIWAFQVFAAAFILTNGGPARSTLFYVYYLFNRAFVYFNMGYASAMAWLLFLIVLVLTVAQLRYSRKWVHYG